MVGERSQAALSATQSGPSDLSPTQEQILDVVTQRPGATIMRVAGALGFSHSTATYHLNRLVQNGVIQRQREGRTLRHFAARAEYGHGTARLAAIMRGESRQRIVRFIARERPSSYNINQIARILGEPFSLVKSVVTGLGKEGFLDVQCINGRYRIQTRPQFLLALANLEEARGIVDLGNPGTKPEESPSGDADPTRSRLEAV